MDQARARPRTQATAPPAADAGARPRVGVSACLLGEPVRFDGGHKRDPFLVETFGPHVEWVPVCPEVEAGLGTPRDTIRLVLVGPPDPPGPGRGDTSGRPRAQAYPADRVAMIVQKTGADVTSLMRQYAGPRAAGLAAADLSGFVLKKDSPSCGMERVKVYPADGAAGVATRAGRGVFAAALLARLPNLPVEEEGRLGDPRLRENFVERIFAYQRVRRLFSGRWSVGDLVRFHTAHKLTLMAHSPAAYRALGRLVAGASSEGRQAVREAYETGFMRALAVVATPQRHANVLQHMLGYFKKTLDEDARAELLHLTEEHRVGRLPLIVPITLFRHHVRRLNVAYLAGQVYLDPHPRELSLRNHV